MGAEHVMTKEDNVVYSLASSFLTKKGMISYGAYLSGDDQIEMTYPNGSRVTQQHVDEFGKIITAIQNSALNISKPTNASLGQYFISQYVKLN
jgi:hypothetical protein